MRFFVIPLLTLSLFVSAGLAKSVDHSSAQIYKSQGDYVKAIEFFNNAVVEYVQNLEKLKSEIPDEKKYNKKSKKIIKYLSETYFELGECHKQLGDYQKMSDNFDKSLDIDDKYYDDIYAYREKLWVDFYNEGVPYFNDKDYEAALNSFNLAVIVDPENIDTYKHRGMCFIQLALKEDDPEKIAEMKKMAIADFDLVIESDTEGREVTVRVNKANVYFQDHDYENAEAAYKDVLTVEEDNMIAVSKLALIYQEQGRSVDAVDMYSKILTTKGDDPDLWFNLGILYFQMEKFLDAQQAFDKVLEINPDDVETIMNLVSAFWKIEMFTEAIPYLEKATQLNPQRKDAWQFLFVAYTKADEIEKANAAFKKFKELEGSSN